MLLTWIQKFIASVPSDFTPTFPHIREGETLKGDVPIDIRPWLYASAWAMTEAKRGLDEHVKEHENLDIGEPGSLDLDIVKRVIDRCREANNRAKQLKDRGAMLGVAAREALIEHFGLEPDVKVEVRVEGIVVVEPPARRLISMLTEFLDAPGVVIET